MRTTTKRRPQAKKPKPQPAARKPKKPQTVWHDGLYLEAYELSAKGFSDARIARALGVSGKRWRRWVQQRPALADAVARGKSSRQPPKSLAARHAGETFIEFACKRLPPDLKALWDRIQSYNGIDPEDGEYNPELEDPDAYRKIDALFSAPGMERARQSLWLHALVGSNFNATEACRQVCVSHGQYLEWCREPKFKELARGIEAMKASFAEAGLFRGIAKDEPSLIMFALRGLKPEVYNPKQVVKHDHKGQVLHAHVDLEKLNEELKDVPLEYRRKMLNAFRKQSSDERAETEGEVVAEVPFDAETQVEAGN